MPGFRRKPVKIMAPKVLVLDYGPAAVRTHWNTTDDLVHQYIETMLSATGRLLVYQVMDKITIPGYPPLLDGRCYDDDTWTQAMQDDKTALHLTRRLHDGGLHAYHPRLSQSCHVSGIRRSR